MSIEEELAQMRAENARVKAENESLKRPGGLSLKIDEKGGLSVYGLQRFPITLYKEQWLKLLDHAPKIRQFIAENEATLAVKAKDKP